MGRLSSIQRLTPDVRVKFDALLSAHPHFTLDQLMSLLAENNLDVCSRSALGRYLAAENGRRSFPPLDDDETVITIIERRSGEVRVLRTPVSATLVAAAVEKLTAKYGVSPQETQFQN